MRAMKILGNPGSTCTRKVLTTLTELGAPYDFEVIELQKGQHKQPGYLQHQPFGQVPVLQDGDFEMYESRAICRYLNETNKGALVPSEPKARAVMEQWISVETSNFTPHAMKFIYDALLGRKQEPAVLEAATKGLETTLGVMEAHLAKNDYFTGKEFTLADISFMPYVEYGMMTPAKDLFAKYPNVMQWWSRVSARPSWQKVSGKAS
ncbi:MAG: putative glutathione S-transferase-like protein [Labilithrix sp.]|nr:putative glutathione S-transferase-like protein [Labilithrix sp.]